MRKIIVFAIAVISATWFVVPPLTNAGNADTSTEMAVNTSSTLPTVLKTMFMRITAYTSVPDETDDTPFITANGTYVHDGIVASNLFPFGTLIKIPALFGDKIFTVEDRTAPRFKDTIDIWMPTYNKAIFFGLNFANIVVVSTSSLSAAATVAFGGK